MIDPSSWKSADDLNLEPNAQIAVKEDSQSIAVVAGPGSGKTELLAQKADFLFQTNFCPYPRRILAIAFKVDAGKNLKERVRLRCGPHLASRLDSYTFHGFAKKLVDIFRPILTGLDALDPDYSIGLESIPFKQVTFQQLLSLAVEILQKSEMAKAALRQTYSHVFLDEFQDCTATQYKLIKEAFEGSGVPLIAVGDTKQSIMGWAGAVDGIFETFAIDFSARALHLYQNFRADARLRRMQNRIIAQMDPLAVMPMEQLTGGGGDIDVLEFEHSFDEAQHIVATINQILSEGVLPHNIAVLVTRQQIAEPILEGLAEAGIPCRNESAVQDLMVEPLAELILDIIRAIVIPSDPVAYRRLLKVVTGGVRDEDEDYRVRVRLDNEILIYRKMHSAGSVNMSDVVSLQTTLNSILTVIGSPTLASLSHEYETGPRLQEVYNQVFGAFSELLENHDVYGLLSHLGEQSAVRIMTIHKSKGLEFDVVFMPAVEQESFWGRDSEAVYFVGVSRARHRLVLSSAMNRPCPSGIAGRWDVLRRRHVRFLNFARE